MIRWFTTNGIAANFLMLAILIAGTYTAVNHVPLEVTPAPENLTYRTSFDASALTQVVLSKR